MEKGGVTAAPRSGKKGVCPWQGYSRVRHLDHFLRPLIHNAAALFGPYVRPGMTVLDVGCGGGFASLGLARLVGNGGRVIAADLQPEMLKMVEGRAKEAGLSGRIRTHVCGPDRIGVKGPVDLAVAFFMVHEVPDTAAFLAEISAVLRTGGHLFVAEPLFHTTKSYFLRLIAGAKAQGLVPVAYPRVFFGRAAVLEKRHG
jgi:ubiquinone/menaquinone biosynthesis C-methylase UbiE